MYNNDLENGIIIGAICSRLEEQKIITFTINIDYDDEFLKLAKRLINEFEKQNEYNYFSEFVQERLIEIEKEYNDEK